jgi:hypothetical protein
VGQEITVTVRAGASANVRMFDCNRSITGMEIFSYDSRDDIVHGRPPDVLARRLFDLGASKVTIYSNDVVVEAPSARWGELEPKVVEAMEHLFGFYGDDAGWADDALRELGVQPLPRPEPTA